MVNSRAVKRENNGKLIPTVRQHILLQESRVADFTGIVREGLRQINLDPAVYSYYYCNTGEYVFRE